MRDLAGWEILLGAAILVFLLRRWRPRSGPPTVQDPDHASDWPGFVGPVLLVALFVLVMIAVLRG